jgi:hypothetical protein
VRLRVPSVRTGTGACVDESAGVGASVDACSGRARAWSILAAEAEERGGKLFISPHAKIIVRTR